MTHKHEDLMIAHQVRIDEWKYDTPAARFLASQLKKF